MPLTKLGGMRASDPAKWEATIRKAMKLHDGAIEPAARELGVSTRQLKRWLAELPGVPRREGGRPAKTS